MGFLPASILVLLYTFPSNSFVSAQSSSSGSYSLSNEVTNFIPLCAQSCFTNFLETNYPQSICSTSPTLDCLCSHNSTSSYTVGEGAVQCIISESNANFCSGVNATGDVVKNAYNMCLGHANALPNTHSTITATLVIQTSVSIAVATRSDGVVASSIITASPTASTGDAGTATMSGSASLSLLITSAPTGQAASQTGQVSTVPTGLTTPQITGIAVGSGVVGIFAIGGLILWACLRRRKMLASDNQSDFGGFQAEHGNSMEHMFKGPSEQKHGVFAPGGTANGVAAKVPPRIPPRLDTDPYIFSRRSVPREEIGVAISPDEHRTQHREPERRHASKLLPEKPALPKLTVVVPEQPVSRPWRPPYNPGQATKNLAVRAPEQARDSVMTQFEEDVMSPEESAKSATQSGIQFEIGYAYTPEYVKAPDAVPWRRGEPPMPPRSMTVPPEPAIRPLEIRKSQSANSFSRPRTGGSSVYSGRQYSPTNEEITPVLNSQAHQRTYKPYNPYTQDQRESSGSITSIESAAAPELRVPEPHVADLSPVAESPAGASPVGRSPVSYPHIRRPSSDHLIRDMKVPRQPDFEPYRRAELDQSRTRRNQAPQDTFGPPLNSVSRASSPRQEAANKDIVAQSSNQSTLLAARRGNKLAPALDLKAAAKKTSSNGQWRVVGNDENILPPLQSPGIWQPKLTPKRIGDDLFLGVQKY